MFQVIKLHNFNFPRYIQPLRKCTKYKSKFYLKASQLDECGKIDQLVKKFAPRLIYNTIIEKKIVEYEHLNKSRRIKTQVDETDPVPLTLKYFDKSISLQDEVELERPENETVNFPFDTRAYSVGKKNDEIRSDSDLLPQDVAATASEEVRKRYDLYKDVRNWMSAYDSYNDAEPEESALEEWKINYGTSDPSSSVSSTPCGGCGALLHCKDTSIPGYIPSEIFKNSSISGGSNLEAIICQRCFFLKHHNVALQVQVTPDDYPQVLKTISDRGGLVILLVDLLDFPCSIWPGIGEIFGPRIPIVLVGNKVDLLPQDSRDFLKRVRKTLLEYVKLQGFATFNIKEVALISAKTGFGVEDLITKLSSHHSVKGDVYIVGCTNVGKSSLFNAFLQSDYCKIQALDLIQRATTSVWPGTTLNLLKFPIKRPSDHRQYLRMKRLEMAAKIQAEEQELRKEQLRRTKNPKFASLVGRIDITHNPSTVPTQPQPEDVFVMKHSGNDSGITKLGLNERSREFRASKWCFDTPGVVQPDQLIHLLTAEELLLTLPKVIVIPRSFCLKPKSVLFIGGLARLDYLEGEDSVKMTVFAAKDLPITICELDDADELYEELLGTELFKVPNGGAERLARWPKLQVGKQFTVSGVNWRESAKDVVLSSAGWIAITGRQQQDYKFQAWTPEKRGVYLRNCLLPHAVALSGKRLPNSVAYNKFNFFLK